MKLISFFIFLSLNNMTFGNDEILKNFEASAKAMDAKFSGFKAVEGEKIFRTERINSKGEKVSCMTCHSNDPKKEGLSRANKVIEPIAPTANKERFTDMAKVEKWFKRNCKDVYERECTVMEKGHFVKYMMSVK